MIWLLISIIVVMFLLLVASLVGNFLLFRSANTQLERAEYLEKYINYAKEHVLQAYVAMKDLDNSLTGAGALAHDDEVGVTYMGILEILDKLNEAVSHPNDEEEALVER